jgi:type III secretion protein L
MPRPWSRARGSEARRIAKQAQQEAEASRKKGYEEGLQRAKAEYALQLVSDTVAAERQLHALRSAMAQIVVKAVGQFIARCRAGGAV